MSLIRSTGRAKRVNRMSKTKDLDILHKNIRTLVLKYDLLPDYSSREFTDDLFRLAVEHSQPD